MDVSPNFDESEPAASALYFAGCSRQRGAAKSASYA
jgi:hypothetical protein